MKNGTSLLSPSICRKRWPLSTANRCSSCSGSVFGITRHGPVCWVGKKRTSLGVRALSLRRNSLGQHRRHDVARLRQELGLMQHLEHV